MTRIIRYDNSCQILDENDEKIIKILDYKLSYKIQGAEYSKAYKGYIDENGREVTWDGRKHLLKSSLHFPSGLLDRVVNIYKEQNIDVEVIDQRRNVSPNTPIDILPKLKELDKEPRDYQIEARDKALSVSRGIIRAATGSGKCESIDSLHITENGILNYEEMLGDTLLDNGESVPYVASVSTSTLFGTKEKTSMIYRDGFGKSKMIKTSYGFHQTATDDHKIQVMNKNGDVEWKSFKDLEVGDFAAICYGTMMFGNNEMSKDEAYWYGLLFGDGSFVMRNQITLTSMDEHIINFAKNYVKKIGFKLHETTKPNCKAIDLKLFSVKYREYLFNLGFEYTKSTNKNIPKSIRSLKKESLSMFVRGLFETDGWVDKHCVCIGLSNKKAIDQLHLILLNFGIVASRRVKKTTHKDSYILSIYRDYLDVFIKEIDFDPNGRKYVKLKKMMEIFSSKPQNSNNFIPHQSIKLNSIISKIKMYDKTLIDKCPINYSTIRSWLGHNGWRNPTKNSLNIFIKYMENNCKNKEILSELFRIKIQMHNIFFDKIINIENSFTDNYDFVVPRSHSFISQGFVNHNTMITAMITAAYGKTTIIYVIGKDLLYQFHKLFSSIFDEEIGIIGDGICNIKRINICTMQSIARCLDIKYQDDDSPEEKEISRDKYRSIKEMLLDTKIHLFDEAHLIAANGPQTISQYVKAEVFLGLSATPWRNDNADILIESVIGNRIIDISAKYLIERGFLVAPDIRFLSVPKYKGKKGKYQTIYSKYIVDNPERNTMIHKVTESLIKQGYKTLVLYKTIKHGKILYDQISKTNKCALLSGDDDIDVRLKVCEDLKLGKIDCIIASSIFDVGVDLPFLGALVIGSGGKSSISTYQRVGRVLRTYPGKKIAPIVDFVDNAPYLYEHSVARKEILEQEFEVRWPKIKSVDTSS